MHNILKAIKSLANANQGIRRKLQEFTIYQFISKTKT